MKGGADRRWRKSWECWRTRCTRRSTPDACGTLKKNGDSATSVSDKSERSQTGSEAPMGNAATRSLEPVAAAMGELGAVPIKFQAGCAT